MSEHDPLCNAYDESRALCNCRFIAKVRENERQAAVQRVESLLNNWGWNPRWVARVIAAIKGGNDD